ncbi:hypothetical protein ACTFIU_008132 [Dictyostelium citrinum]
MALDMVFKHFKDRTCIVKESMSDEWCREFKIRYPYIKLKNVSFQDQSRIEAEEKLEVKEFWDQFGNHASNQEKHENRTQSKVVKHGSKLSKFIENFLSQDEKVRRHNITPRNYQFLCYVAWGELLTFNNVMQGWPKDPSMQDLPSKRDFNSQNLQINW